MLTTETGINKTWQRDQLVYTDHKEYNTTHRDGAFPCLKKGRKAPEDKPRLRFREPFTGPLIPFPLMFGIRLYGLLLVQKKITFSIEPSLFMFDR